MPRKKHSELATGFFVIATLGITLGVVVWMGPGLLTSTRQRAVFYAPESYGSAGIAVGSFVQINDKQIGKISEIAWDGENSRTLYVADIQHEGVTIHADAKAQVVAGLVGGEKLVITRRGSPDKPLADADNPVELTGGLDRAMGDLYVAANNLKDVSETVKLQLGAAQAGSVLKKIHDILDKIRQAGSDVAKIAANIRAETQADSDKSLLSRVRRSATDLNAMTASLARESNAEADGSIIAKAHGAMDDIKAVTADAKPKISRTLAATADAAEQIRAYARKDLAEILTKLRQANTEVLKIAKDLGEVSSQAKEIVTLNRDNMDEMIDNMTQVSVNLKSVSKEVRRNPWRLLYEPTDRELHSQNIYDAARAFANGASELDQAITKLKALDPKTADPELVNKIREHLNATFTRFSRAEEKLWKEMQK